MSPWLVDLVQNYGLLAIFAGCMAEGESFAVLGGFLSHHGFFAPWNALAVIFFGAFIGDTLFYLAGRYFASTPSVARIRQRPGFARVLSLVQDHPAKFVILNRYAYGFRLIGGVAAGIAHIPVPQFVTLNALSSAIWAVLFGALGWFFGLGVEQLVGETLQRHHKLAMGLAIGVVVAIAGLATAHHYASKAKRGD